MNNFDVVYHIMQCMSFIESCNVRWVNKNFYNNYLLKYQNCRSELKQLNFEQNIVREVFYKGLPSIWKLIGCPNMNVIERTSNFDKFSEKIIMPYYKHYSNLAGGDVQKLKKLRDSILGLIYCIRITDPEIIQWLRNIPKKDIYKDKQIALIFENADITKHDIFDLGVIFDCYPTKHIAYYIENNVYSLEYLANNGINDQCIGSESFTSVVSCIRKTHLSYSELKQGILNPDLNVLTRSVMLYDMIRNYKCAPADQNLINMDNPLVKSAYKLLDGFEVMDTLLNHIKDVHFIDTLSSTITKSEESIRVKHTAPLFNHIYNKFPDKICYGYFIAHILLKITQSNFEKWSNYINDLKIPVCEFSCMFTHVYTPHAIRWLAQNILRFTNKVEVTVHVIEKIKIPTRSIRGISKIYALDKDCHNPAGPVLSGYLLNTLPDAEEHVKYAIMTKNPKLLMLVPDYAKYCLDILGVFDSIRDGKVKITKEEYIKHIVEVWNDELKSKVPMRPHVLNNILYLLDDVANNRQNIPTRWSSVGYNFSTRYL